MTFTKSSEVSVLMSLSSILTSSSNAYSYNLESGIIDRTYVPLSRYRDVAGTYSQFPRIRHKSLPNLSIRVSTHPCANHSPNLVLPPT